MVDASGIANSGVPDRGPPGESAPPNRPLRLLFLHHSIGAHLLADEGPDAPDGSTHPSGGGLRRALIAAGYQVHEATYGSPLGERTDMFDWLPKFRDHMDTVLRIAHQDELLAPGINHDVVLFKSCFPNNEFVGPGVEPGHPEGPVLTESNARATLRALLPIFATRPSTLFVFLSTPPLAPLPWPESPVKGAIKRLLGRPDNKQKFAATGESARRFNDWVARPDGWLDGYAGKNVGAFDYYGVLTDHGASNFLRYPTGTHGQDSHPSALGQKKAAAELVPFLNRAVRRAGLLEGSGRQHAQASPNS